MCGREVGQDPAPPFLATVSGFAGPSWSLNCGGAPGAQSQASFHKFFMGSPEDLVPALPAVRLQTRPVEQVPRPNVELHWVPGARSAQPTACALGEVAGRLGSHACQAWSPPSRAGAPSLPCLWWKPE